MKKVVSILSLLFFLAIRQSSPVITEDKLADNYIVHAEHPFITGVAVMGWIEDSKRIDPKASASGLPVYHLSDLIKDPVETQECYAFLYHYQPNPLLIDRPPPDIIA